MLTCLIQGSPPSPRLLLVLRGRLVRSHLSLPPEEGQGEESDTWERKKRQWNTQLRKRSLSPHLVYLQPGKDQSPAPRGHQLCKAPHLLQGKGKPHPLEGRARPRVLLVLLLKRAHLSLPQPPPHPQLQQAPHPL